MYYIVNYGNGPEVDWISSYASLTAFPGNTIGPYFSYKEAVAVLCYWTK